MKYLLSFLLCLPMTGFAQTTPKEIVDFALKNMTNGNFKALLDVTENAEKRKTQELIAQLEANPRRRDEVMGEYKLLQSYTIEEVTYLTNSGRELAIVATRWVIKVPLERAPKNLVASDKNAKSEKVVYMDYMLEYKNKLWKIISQRAL